MVALAATVTLAPASPAVACFVHARPRVAVPSWPCSRVQPAGLPSVPVRELTVMNSTRVSPACIPLGRVTVWFSRLPTLLVAPTNDNTGSAAFAAGTGLNPKAASAVANTHDESRHEPAPSRRGHAWCRHGWSPPGYLMLGHPGADTRFVS